MLGAVERLDRGGESERREEDLSHDVRLVWVDRRNVQWEEQDEKRLD